MNKKMKVLIGYDGSGCADAALDDLQRAGLTREAEAVVLSVTEVWLPPPPPSSYEIVVAAQAAEHLTTSSRFTRVARRRWKRRMLWLCEPQSACGITFPNGRCGLKHLAALPRAS